MKVTVTSAQALSSAQKSKLEKNLAKTAGKSANFNYEVDQAVLGGLRVTYGSTEYDTTLKTKLQQLQNQLMETL